MRKSGSCAGCRESPATGCRNPLTARAPQLFCGARGYPAILAGDQAGVCPAVRLRFSTLARPPPYPFETGPGDEPRWRMNVLGDMEQLG